MHLFRACFTIKFEYVCHVGKQKVNKHGTGQQSTKAQTNTTQKLKQPSVGASFNGITTTPGTGEENFQQIFDSILTPL